MGLAQNKNTNKPNYYTMIVADVPIAKNGK